MLDDVQEKLTGEGIETVVGGGTKEGEEVSKRCGQTAAATTATTVAAATAAPPRLLCVCR